MHFSCLNWARATHLRPAHKAIMHSLQNLVYSMTSILYCPLPLAQPQERNKLAIWNSFRNIQLPFGTMLDISWGQSTKGTTTGENDTLGFIGWGILILFFSFVTGFVLALLQFSYVYDVLHVHAVISWVLSISWGQEFLLLWHI